MPFAEIRDIFDRRPLLTSTMIGGAVGLAAASSIYAVGNFEFVIIPYFLGGISALFGISAASSKDKVTGVGIATGGITALLASFAFGSTQANVNESVCVPFNSKTLIILNEYPNLSSDDNLQAAFKEAVTEEITQAYVQGQHPLAEIPSEDNIEYGGAILPYTIMPLSGLQTSDTQICVAGMRDKFTDAMVDQTEVVHKIQARFLDTVTARVQELRIP
jgi:hypothetical protein